MIAALNPTGKADAVAARLRDVRSHVAAWLVRDGVVPRGTPSEQMAEFAMLDHLFGLAREREGMKGVALLTEAAANSAERWLTLEEVQ